MEKIINEFRVVETDDGFRIEIKGDKEKLRSFVSGFNAPRRGRHWHRHGRGAAWGPFTFAPWMWMKAAACCGEWDSEVDKEETEEPSTA